MVATVAVVLVAGALAPIALRAHRAYANLIGEAGRGARGDEVATCSLVGDEYVLGMKLEET